MSAAVSPGQVSGLGEVLVEQTILEMKNIKKSFSGVYALENINFDLRLGEVHALLGGNGAGKSTLIKVLGGVYRPDSGEIFIHKKKTDIGSVPEARKLGIGIIHQEIVLVPHLTVAENIFLGREPANKLGLRDIRAIFSRAQQMVDQIGVDIDVRRRVEELTIAQQQLVEIVKEVSFEARILVMDEPTSSLEENEVKLLFEIIRKLKKQSVSIIYISHKMDEIFEISDRVTVIRDGAYVGTRYTSETNADELVKLMVGRSFNSLFTRSDVPIEDEVLRVEGLTKKGVFSDITFSVHKGEVLGFTGLVGAGRSEIMQALFGADHYDKGQVYLRGKPVRFSSASQAIAHGVAMVPEDRKKQGLVLSGTVGFNITLAALRRLSGRMFVRRGSCGRLVDEYIGKLNIKVSSPQQTISNLSGGNQQKAVIAKWLSTEPELLILDEPTRGIDVGAKQEIYALIDRLSRQGMAIIMISSELPEIMNMCDNVCVVREGEIVARLGKAELSQENIMAHATGGVE